VRVPTRAGKTRYADRAILVLLGALVVVPAGYHGKHVIQTLRSGLRATIEPERIRDRTFEPPGRKEMLRNWLTASWNEVPRIFIDIGFEDHETLRRKRREALEAGFLFRSEDDQVPATIRHEGRQVKVRVRLKGDFLDHLTTEKWSLRVETRRGEELFGLRRFSLQAPHTRFYQLEPLFLDHARREGLLAVRSFFVDVTLNGDRMGLMNVEEHFSKELLESQGKPEGVIVGYDETDFWHSYRRSRVVEQTMEEQGQERELAKTFDNWKVGRVEPFRRKKVAQSPLLSGHADLAVGMLRGMAQGTLRPSEIFDADLLGRYVAICDMWGLWHPLRFHNLRFYLNPVTLKLEPVAFDGAVGKNWRRGLFSFRLSHFFSFVIADPEVTEAYRKHMRRLFTREYRDDLEAFLAERESVYLGVLHREFPDIGRFDFDTIGRKYTLMERLDSPSPFTLRPYEQRRIFDVEYPPHSAAVYAYVVERAPGSGPVVELINPLGSPVIVDELMLESGEGSVPLADLAEVRLPLTLQPSFHDPWPWQTTPPPESVYLRLPDDLDPQSTRVTGTAHVEGRQHRYVFDSMRYVAPLETSPFSEQADLADVLAAHPSLEWTDGIFSTRPGRWQVAGSMRIPRLLVVEGDSIRNSGLTVTAGTTLEFEEEAYLRLFGPLHMEGRPDAPAALRGREGRSWRGLLVSGSPERSVWSNATVADTDFTEDGPWRLTGGVTFYESDVTMTDCRFERTTAEDALNIIRSEFELNGVSIENTASDALDSDFSEGTVLAGRFESIGGDGIDLSGSEVRIRDTRFIGVRDKALSVGEASRLHASAVEIRGAGAALASKDGSSAILEEAILRDIGHFALMAYNKKPEYGPASLSAISLDYDGSGELQACQRRQMLTIDGKRMHTQRIDVEALYEEGFMRK